MINVKAKAGYTVTVGDKTFFLDHIRYDILNYINESNSMVQASKKTDLSYRSVLNYIGQIEEGLGISVVDSKKGGRGGGGSTVLSDEGKILLKECEKVNALLELHQDFNEIEATVSNVDKNYGLMEIEINPDLKLKCSIKEDYNVGDKILALISYDNIFILSEDCKSSIRNIFKGKIIEMGINKENIRIKIDINGYCLYSDITLSAQKDLELELGKEVYIGFKAVSIATMKL